MCITYTENLVEKAMAKVLLSSKYQMLQYLILTSRGLLSPITNIPGRALNFVNEHVSLATR